MSSLVFWLAFLWSDWIHSLHTKFWSDYIKDANKASQILLLSRWPQILSRKPILAYSDRNHFLLCTYCSRWADWPHWGQEVYQLNNTHLGHVHSHLCWRKQKSKMSSMWKCPFTEQRLLPKVLSLLRLHSESCWPSGGPVRAPRLGISSLDSCVQNAGLIKLLFFVIKSLPSSSSSECLSLWPPQFESWCWRISFDWELHNISAFTPSSHIPASSIVPITN